MNQSNSLTPTAQIQATSLLDLGIIAAIYFLPAVTHILPIPLYLVDPMRLLMFLTLLTTHRTNSLVLAATIPFLSTLFSGHPVFPKNLLIAIELSLNVMVFHFLFARVGSTLLAGMVSILLAKLAYYLLKFGFLSFGLLGGVLITTPLHYQLIPLILLPIMLVGMAKMINRGQGDS